MWKTLMLRAGKHTPSQKRRSTLPMPRQAKPGNQPIYLTKSPFCFRSEANRSRPRALETYCGLTDARPSRHVSAMFKNDRF